MKTNEKHENLQQKEINPYYLKNNQISLEDLSKVEMIKAFSNFLRGTIKEELNQDTPYFDENTIQVIKFHGMYQQDDRDKRVRRMVLIVYHQILCIIKKHIGEVLQKVFLGELLEQSIH